MYRVPESRATAGCLRLYKVSELPQKKKKIEYSKSLGSLSPYEIAYPGAQSHNERFSTQMVEWEGGRMTLVIQKVPKKSA